MPIGPIVTRELIAAARRPRMYRRRSSLAILMLLLVGLNYGVLYLRYQGTLSVAGFRAVMWCTFGGLIFFHYVLASELVPAYVAGLIAGERERRTIGDLLVTRLSSAEIVLGKLTAGLAQFATTFAIGVPALVLMPLLCGFDPTTIALACAGMASTAFFVGGLSILVSTGCRRSGRAIAAALLPMFAWLIIPLLLMGFLRGTTPRLVPWVFPVNRWLLASSPSGVMAQFAIQLVTGGRMHDAIVWIQDELLWMIGLQMAGGTLLIGLAIARLRPVARKLEDGESNGRARARARHSWRLMSRPSCGDRPVLWKEIHTAKSGGVADLLGILAVVAIFGWIGYMTYRVGAPALVEWWQYGSSRTAPDASRWVFNNYLRGITSVIELVCLLIVAGAAAEGVAAERARSTWESLLATTLGGREILTAKMLGAVWKTRGGIALLLALWSAGMLTGALHPLGVLAALALLFASFWFVAVLGMHASLISRDVAHATTRTIVPLILLTGTFVLCYWPSRMTSVVMGAGSIPLVNCLGLISYREFAEALGQGSFSYLTVLGIASNEGAGRVLMALLIAIFGYTAAAAWLTRTVIRRFDQIAGRAVRSPGSDTTDSTARADVVNRNGSERRSAIPTRVRSAPSIETGRTG